MKPLLPITCIVVLSLILSACQRTETTPLTHLHGSTMGTEYHVKIVHLPTTLQAKTLQNALDQRLQAINAVMSTYQDDSELSRFNQNTATDWISVSAELFHVVQSAQQFAQRTQGAFDITVGPLVNLWGFGPAVKAQQIPALASIEQARARIGFQALTLRAQPPALKKTRPDLYVDLSAIAKGYAVDQLAEYLETQGIEHYLVDIGGELRTRGRNAAGHAWRIAVEQPVPGRRAVQRLIALPDMSVATSGNYRNFITLQGQRFSHTIDPLTGWPVTHRLVSATVLHPQAMQADAWATSFMVLGVEKALQLAAQEQLAVFLLEETEHGIDEHFSSAFKSVMLKDNDEAVAYPH